MGKPIVQSREEIDTACERAQTFIDLASDALEEEVIEKSHFVSKSIIKEPVSQDLNVYGNIDWNCVDFRVV